jgi:hypothetical protein
MQGIKPGTYSKGSIPKGEYVFVGPKGGYFSEEYNGQILANENFASFGYVYVQGLGDITTRGYLISMDDLKKLGNTGALEIYKTIIKEAGYNFSGYYKVGLDIEPGTYELESSSDGYVSVESGPLGRSKTVKNDIFQGKKTINILAGQYLKVNRATITPLSVQSPEKSASSGPVLKVDSLILALKSSSNPFEIRNKALGKSVETQIFVERFVDEGEFARMIDANSGFFCRMKGEEFGKHNKRGVIVVRGTLVEDGGKFGLDNCKFISNDVDWKATDNSFEDLIQ